MENTMTTAQLPPQVPTLVIKVKCGDDYRKFKYPTSGGDLMDLKSRVQRLYQLAPSDPLPLKYKDGDNDWITLGDDDDLRLAMELEKGKELVLKVLVEKPSVEVAKMGDRMSKMSFAQPQQQPQMPQMPTPPPQIPSYPQANPQQQRPTISSYPQQQQQQYQPPTIPSYPQQQPPPQQYQPQPATMPSYPPSGHY